MISGGNPTLQLGQVSQAVTSFLRETPLMLGWGLSSFQTSSVFVHTVMCERVIYGFSSKMGTCELLEMTDPRNIAGNSLVPFRGARVVPARWLENFPHIIFPSPQEDCQGQFLTSTSSSCLLDCETEGWSI